MDEDQFWCSTLRKICGLLDIYNNINNPKNKSKSNKENKNKGEKVTLKCVD